MAKFYNFKDIDKESSIGIVLGCSYSDDDFWNQYSKVQISDPPGPWPMWGELFYEKVNENRSDKLTVINLAVCGSGLDQMIKRFYKIYSLYKDRIKFVVLGGSGIERWDWPLCFQDLEWTQTNPGELNEKELGSEKDRYVGSYSRGEKGWRAVPSNKSNWQKAIKENEFNAEKSLIATFDTMQTLEARTRFLAERKIIYKHFNSEDPALWNDPAIIDVLLKDKLTWEGWLGLGKFNWFEKEYYKGALHQHHSYLRGRQHFDVKYRFTIEFCQKLLQLMHFCNALNIEFLYYQLLPLFEWDESSDIHTQPWLPFCINLDATSDEIFLTSDLYDDFKKNKKNIVNFDPYQYHNYDRWLSHDKLPSQIHKIQNKDGEVIDGHPGALGQELIAKHAWDWYTKYW